MKVTENLELEEKDLQLILTYYLKSYKFYSKGKMPEKLVLPKLDTITIQTQVIPPVFETVPVMYREWEKPDVADRHSGTRDDSKPAKAVSPSVSDKPKPIVKS